MNSPTTTIEVDSSAALILQASKAKAEAQGISLATLLRPLADNEVNGTVERPLYETATPDELADDFLAWVETHSIKGTVADDSRESIYTREDEAL